MTSGVKEAKSGLYDATEKSSWQCGARAHI